MKYPPKTLTHEEQKKLLDLGLDMGGVYNNLRAVEQEAPNKVFALALEHVGDKMKAVMAKNGSYINGLILMSNREKTVGLAVKPPGPTNTKPGDTWAAGDRAIVLEDWDYAGAILPVLGPAVFVKQWWVPVIDPECPDPTWIKEAALKKIVY